MKKSIKEYRSFFEKNNIRSIIEKNSQKVLDPNFWKDKALAQKVIKEKNFHEDLVKSFENSKKEIKDLSDLYDLAVDENNQTIIKDLVKSCNDLQIKSKKNEIKCFLSNESDILDCYIEIHAGAGGTESQDWAEMLKRMYLKWAQNKKYKYLIISEHKGDEAGIKSTTFQIHGEYLYGWLKSESGIHRLVRVSPFDSGARRHTSFASV